jgi:hypothetical protein
MEGELSTDLMYFSVSGQGAGGYRRGSGF